MLRPVAETNGTPNVAQALPLDGARRVQIRPFDARFFGLGPKDLHILPLLVEAAPAKPRRLFDRFRAQPLPAYDEGMWSYFVPEDISPFDSSNPLSRHVRAVGELAVLRSDQAIVDRHHDPQALLHLEREHVDLTGEKAMVSFDVPFTLPKRLLDATLAVTTLEVGPLVIS